MVTLYQGGQYNLYRYKKYTDVRLVFVPEFQAAFFGGDPDNFNFPRFNIDMALVPCLRKRSASASEHYFKWSTAGVKEGDLVFVTGNPGSTSRLNTVAHLEQLRDTSIPIILRLLERREAVLKKYMAMGEEQTRQAQNELNSVQNSLKVYRGSLKDSKIRVDGSQDKKSRRCVNRSPRIRNDRRCTAMPGTRSRRLTRRIRATFANAASSSNWRFQHHVVHFARTLVRLAEENEKPNAERLPEYTDARRASLELALIHRLRFTRTSRS